MYSANLPSHIHSFAVAISPVKPATIRPLPECGELKGPEADTVGTNDETSDLYEDFPNDESPDVIAVLRVVWSSRKSEARHSRVRILSLASISMRREYTIRPSTRHPLRPQQRHRNTCNYRISIRLTVPPRKTRKSISQLTVALSAAPTKVPRDPHSEVVHLGA